MARVLVTGMSGVGKTTLLEEMSRRGYEAVDTDDDGWTLPDGTWDEPRMARLLAERTEIVISGTVTNQGRFYDRFDHVVLLSAPLHVLLDRVANRPTNPYGKAAEQRAEIERYVGEVEPLLRRGATVELDGRRPVGQLADILERLPTATPHRAERYREEAAVLIELARRGEPVYPDLDGLLDRSPPAID